MFFVTNGRCEQQQLFSEQMSSDRHESSRGSHGANPHDRSLPPIRDVLRDELDRPARPSPYSFGDVRGALPSPVSTHGQWRYQDESGRRDHRGSVTLPPIQSEDGYHSSRSIPNRYTSQYTSQTSPTSPPYRESRSSRDPSEDLGYSYGVLRTSSASGGLVHATPPSGRPQGILRQTSTPVREDEEDLSKRYKCEYCGKRFGMPSHLEIHRRTHTAQRPFACEWPGCDRTFSVRSNMMRHYRSHGKSGSSRQEYLGRSQNEDDEDTGGEQDIKEEGASSARYFHKTISSDHHSPSQYYSSSRRK